MSRSMLSLEAQLLLACGELGGNDARLRALLAGPLVWDRVLLLAHRQRAAAVLLRRLAALPDAGVPPEALDQLRKLAMVLEFLMVRLRQRLDETLDVLAQAGIEPVLLKGAALCYTLYPSMADRPMADIDLLVEPGQARRAREELLRAGWKWNETVRREEDYQAHHHLPPMDDVGGSGLKVEVHTELFVAGNPFHLSGDVMRRDAQSVVAGGRRVRVPSPMHQLLHTCLHFAWSHNMRAACWRAFRDVAVVTHPAFDWDEFVTVARQNRAGTCCYWTLRLAHDLLSVPVPAATLEALRPPLPGPLLRRLERHFVIQLLPTEPSCPSIALEKLLWGIGVMPKWSGHGTSRPWDEADSLLAKRRQRQPAPGSSKAMRQLRNLAQWGRYVRAVLAPAAPKEPRSAVAPL
jgi:hypothetical protein